MDLNQITLGVTDFGEAVAFYRRIGLKLIVSSRGEYARFECPEGGSTLSLHLTDEPAQNGPVVYFECEDIDARYAELKERGVVFDGPPRDESWRWRETRFADPSGNRLCLYHAGSDRRYPPWRIADEAED